MRLQTLICDTCQESWSRPAVRDRKPQTCPACASARAVPSRRTASAVPEMERGTVDAVVEVRARLWLVDVKSGSGGCGGCSCGA